MFMPVPGPAMTMFGVLLTSSPALGAPLFPLVHVAVAAVCPLVPAMEAPDMPVMPAIAVLDDS
jgi:hypothetical protein